MAQYRAKADRRLDRLLAMPIITEAGAELQRQTKRWRAQFFTFLTDRAVPPSNNASERALRPSVIFRKVTNGFRSLWGMPKPAPSSAPAASTASRPIRLSHALSPANRSSPTDHPPEKLPRQRLHSLQFQDHPHQFRLLSAGGHSKSHRGLLRSY
ncbi:Mobile element protein [Azospirillum argentinense]